MSLWKDLFPVGKPSENQLRTLAMNEKPKEDIKSRLWTGESPDYYGVVVITDPTTPQRNVMILTPDAALCLADILRVPASVVALEAELRKAALSQQGKSVQACDREVNMLALSVQREKPTRLDS
jgi:hypothetical protein